MLDVLVRTWNVVLGIVCLYGGGYTLTLHLASWDALRGDILVMSGILIVGGYISLKAVFARAGLPPFEWRVL